MDGIAIGRVGDTRPSRGRSMLIARWIFMLLALAAVVCFAFYIGTGEMRFRRIGVLILKWSVTAGLAFFAVLLLEHLTALH